MTPLPAHLRGQRRTLGQLSTLVDAARALTRAARLAGLDATAEQVRRIGLTLDAARTHLIEDVDYTPAAAAFIDPAADRLACHATYIGRARRHART